MCPTLGRVPSLQGDVPTMCLTQSSWKSVEDKRHVKQTWLTYGEWDGVRFEQDIVCNLRNS